MADVMHRQTREIRHSVNTPDYSSSEWLIDPDLSAVAETPPEYWIVDGDAVRPATESERAEIDAATAAPRLAAAKRARLATLAARQAEIDDVGVVVSEKRFRTGDEQRRNYLEVLTFAVNMPPETPIPFWDADGNYYELPAPQAKALMLAYAVAAAEVRKRWFAVWGAVEMATSIEALEAITL
jgi:hypothetical protein